MEDIKNIIETLLFVSEDPLTIDRFKKVLESADTHEIKNALSTLSEEYDARNGGFVLREIAGGYQIRTRPEYAKWIKRLTQPGPQRLSKAALETLAIIAYKQPLIRTDIEFIRGVDCGGVLRMLLERKLIRVLGRKEIPGRPMIYATTKHFLELFDLKDLKDLPTPKEIQELGNSSPLEVEPPMENEQSEEIEGLHEINTENDMEESVEADQPQEVAQEKDIPGYEEDDQQQEENPERIMKEEEEAEQSQEVTRQGDDLELNEVESEKDVEDSIDIEP